MPPRISREDLRDILIGLAYALRGAGERVGTSELVEAHRIIADYMALERKEYLAPDELLKIVVSIWPPAARRKRLLEAELSKMLAGKGVEERARRILDDLLRAAHDIGARPGDRVSLKSATKGRSKKERARARAAFARLRRVGAIARRGGREKLVDQAGLRAIALRLARQGFSSLEEAASAGRLPGSMDDLMLMAEARIPVARESLEGLSESRLLRAGWAALRKRDYRTQRAVGEELRRRIARGEPVRDPEGVVELLRRAGMLTSDVLIGLAMRGEPVPGLDPGTVADIAESLGVEAGGRLISGYRKVMDREKYLDLASRVDPRLLWGVRPGSVPREYRELVEAAASAAMALREAMEYARTLDPARADMARHYAAKASSLLARVRGPGVGKLDRDSIEALIGQAEGIVSSVEGIGSGIVDPSIVDVLATMDLPDAVEVLRSAYGNTSSSEARRLLVNAMDRLLARASSNVGLLPVGGRRRSPRGRLELRPSLYNIIRMRERPLVFTVKRMSRPLSLALDTSGSMSRYSAWALAVAALFSRHIERLVMFSHEIHVYRGPFSRRDLARILLEAEFGGRTDIGRAIEAAAGRGRSRLVIAVTDLAQTVAGPPPWEVAADLRRRGVEIVFVTHRHYDRDARKRLEEEGARVLVARGPRDAARRLLHIIRR